MNKYLAVFFFILLSIILSANPAITKENVKDVLTPNNTGRAEICNAVKKSIRNGLDTKKIVSTNIRAGRDACYVIGCAIDGGGDLRLIITGAMETGLTSDVVARCTLNAGAEPAVITGIYEGLGLDFGHLDEEEDLMQAEIDPPAGSDGGRYFSPASF
ncbi:MAG: hypothetical protein VST72_05715 [Nitrospirota bacterium]|nr:hypothetical protein [Nitrospirota bacterium]